jgi:hypothetical protein
VKIEGVEYEFVRASDLERDGMALECHRVSAAGGRTLVLAAFWHDPTGRFSVQPSGEEVPFALVREFVRRAAEACPPIWGDEPGFKTLIYVPLLDEGTDVWRPVSAESCGDDLYRITDEQPIDEQWAFAPGSVVRCSEHRFQDGLLGLAAVERAG